MTIAVRIMNTNGHAANGLDPLVRVSYLDSGHQGVGDPGPMDLGPGDECTCHIHTGASLLIEERSQPGQDQQQAQPQGQDQGKAGDDAADAAQPEDE